MPFNTGDELITVEIDWPLTILRAGVVIGVIQDRRTNALLRNVFQEFPASGFTVWSMIGRDSG
jgi:hypothetical protein